MPGIGIVTNPNSRRNRRYPERMRRLGYILGKDDVYEMTNQVQDVTKVAEEFKENDIDVLALNGGDGTNHVTLTTFIKVYKEKPLPKIAFLRGGTMNTISNAVGISGTPGKILLSLVERYYTRQPLDVTERDMLKVTDEHDTRYGFIFGNGIISNFLNIYYQDPSPSPWVAAKLLARTIAETPFNGPMSQEVIRPFHAEMIIDGQHWPMQDYTTIGIATIEQIGLGFRPFIYCENKKHSFHVSAFHTTDPIKVVRSLPYLRLGQRPNEDTARYFSSSHTVMRSDEPILYTIDGDMHCSERGEVTIEAGPRLQIVL